MSDAFYAIYIPSKEYGKLYLSPLDGNCILKESMLGAAFCTSMEQAKILIKLLGIERAEVQRVECEVLTELKDPSAAAARDMEQRLNGRN